MATSAPTLIKFDERYVPSLLSMSTEGASSLTAPSRSQHHLHLLLPFLSLPSLLCRLYFTTFPSPLPSASTLNKSPLTRKLPTSSTSRAGAQTSSPPPSSGDDDEEVMLKKGKGKERETEGGKDLHWLSVDNELVYQSFAKDFGP